MKNADIKNYICNLHLYSSDLVTEVLDAQISYLTAFLHAGEEVETVAFCHLKYADAKFGPGTLVFFTDRRIIYGYKYMWGLIKAFGEISYDRVMMPTASSKTEVVLDTKNGAFSFATMQDVGHGEGSHVTVNARYMTGRICILLLRYMLKSETTSAEIKQKAEEVLRSSEEMVDHFNDSNKAYQYCVNCIHMDYELSKEERDKYIKNGWKNGVLADHPECADKEVAYFVDL